MFADLQSTVVTFCSKVSWDFRVPDIWQNTRYALEAIMFCRYDLILFSISLMSFINILEELDEDWI